jgi:hypothetical protein
MGTGNTQWTCLDLIGQTVFLFLCWFLVTVVVSFKFPLSFCKNFQKNNHRIWSISFTISLVIITSTDDRRLFIWKKWIFWSGSFLKKAAFVPRNKRKNITFVKLLRHTILVVDQQSFIVNKYKTLLKWTRKCPQLSN